MVPFHYIGKIRQKIKEFLVSREKINNVVILKRRNLIEFAKSLASDRRE